MTSGGPRPPIYLCKPASKYGKFKHCFSAAAAFVDAVIEREVLAALTPVGVQAALRIINESLADQDSNHKSRDRQLQLAKDAVADAHRRYDAVDPTHDLVKADLEERLQSAIKTLKHLELRHRADTPTHPVSLGQADADELVRLAQDIPSLWHAPTTTDEDRKELVRTLISKIVLLEKAEEAIELEIEWIDGRRQIVRAYRPKGVDRLVRELHGAGINEPDAIVEELRSQGITNAFGRPMSIEVVRKALYRHGLTQTRQWIEALLIIRQLVLDGWSRRQILARLRSRGPSHPLEEWTSTRIESAITRLRLGTVPSEVPPLPPQCRVAPSIETPPEAVQLIIAGRTSRPRRLWRDIVNDLNARGLNTATGRSFTVPLARSLFHNWKLKGAVKEAAREQDPAR
jgi:hypothetical protein